MQFNQLLALLLTLSTVSSCKLQTEPKSKSAPKFADNLDTSEAVNFLNLGLTSAQTKAICKQSPIFIYVGNAEFASVDIKGAQRQFNYLETQIKQDTADLESALSKMIIECTTSASALNPVIPQAMLLTITDGPGSKDSLIKSVWYSFDLNKAKAAGSVNSGYSPGWVISETKNWKTDDKGALVENATGAPFEVHLPTQLESIVRQALKFKAPGGADFKFNQTFYFIKSHGGRFASGTTDEGIEGLFKSMVAPAKTQNVSHAFLFDPNGPGSEKKVSDLFGFGLPVADACKKFSELDSKTFQASKDICSKCQPHLAALTAKGGLEACSVAAASPSPTASAAVPASSSTTPGQLDPYTNGTLDPYTNGTLDPYTNGTLDPYTNGTLDPYTNGTLGAGKSLFLTVKPNLETWRDVFQLGAGIQYGDSAKVAGLTSMALPLLGSGDSPPMIVLDSCWGSTAIASSVFKAEGSNGVLVVMNQNPMGISSINYKAFDAFQYRALPVIYKIAADNESIKPAKLDPGIVKAKEKVDSLLTSQGLINRRAATQTDLSTRQIKIEFLQSGSNIGK